MGMMDWISDNHEAVDIIIKGLIAVIGFPLLVWRSIVAHRTATAAVKQAKTAEQGQITDRFTKAVEQFGSENIHIRMGGIFALGGIAHESKQHHWPIMQLLSAFIREKSPVKECESDDYNLIKIAPDIQTALTVIGSRKEAWDKLYSDGEMELIDLSHTYLCGARLEGMFFSGINLLGSNLQRTSLYHANLQDALLYGVDFRSTSLHNTKLTGAMIKEANLSGAHLHKAIGLTQEGLNSAKGDSKTWLPSGLVKPQHWE